jgi:predicted P-loop ATPase
MTAPWFQLCQLEGNKAIPNLFNAYIALENSHFADRFSYNEMLCTPMIEQSEPVPVGDDEVDRIQKWMQSEDIRRIGTTTVRQAIVMRAKQRPYHPIRQWLDSLTWDGTRRLETFGITYLGCEDTPYVRAVCEMFLISMVARVYQPGCKVDYMLILEGSQGILKSAVCSALAGDQYFSDDLPEKLHDKDTKLHLRGKWLIEVAEMHAFNRAESTELKRFITRREEQYRPPYGGMEVTEPRQCVFIGTSNKDAYLRDETGGRRFWPVKCGTIRLNDLKRDRDQIFAEAAALYHAGTVWWPDRKFEAEFIKPEQDQRYEDDAWGDPVRSWLSAQIGNEFTMAEIAFGALGLERSRLGMMEQKRIASILQMDGWKKIKSHGRMVWRAPGSVGTVGTVPLI